MRPNRKRELHNDMYDLLEQRMNVVMSDWSDTCDHGGMKAEDILNIAVAMLVQFAARIISETRMPADLAGKHFARSIKEYRENND